MKRVSKKIFVFLTVFAMLCNQIGITAFAEERTALTEAVTEAAAEKDTETGAVPVNETTADTEKTEVPAEETAVDTEKTEVPAGETEADTKEPETGAGETAADTEKTEAPAGETAADTKEPETGTAGTEAPAEETEADTKEPETGTAGTEAPAEETLPDTEASEEEETDGTEETEKKKSKKTAKKAKAEYKTGDVIAVTELSDLTAGTYTLSTSLSCYVTAMGGVEFGASLLEGAVLTVNQDGSASITIDLGTSSVNIYGITADTYISTEGMTGYYDGSSWQNASYTTDAAGHVDKITFPITKINGSYQLALMVGSNIMSTQFGSDSKYAATLTVNWDQVTVGDNSSSGGSGSGETEPEQPKETESEQPKETESEQPKETEKETEKTGTVIQVSSLKDLEAGKTYGLNAALSCYVNAMGGVEFGASLLKNAVLKVDAQGNAAITLTFGTSSVTIYSVTAKTYISAEGKIGYQDGSSWKTASFTKNSVGQVQTMTFPVTAIKDAYQLSLMVGSDVMSTQFGMDSKYVAVLSVDWSKVVTEGTGSAGTTTPGDVTAPSETETESEQETEYTTEKETEQETENQTNVNKPSKPNKPNKGQQSGTIAAISSLSDLEAGKTYGLNAGLSCYVNAMGGVEFGASLLKNAVLKTDADGNASITITLGTSSVTIYGVTADTYVSTEGMIAYYDGSSWQSASYTTDGAGHVTSITFPISSIKNTYQLAFTIGSNVMSTQFGGPDSNYPAALSINWGSVRVDGSGTVNSSGTAYGTSPQTGDDTSMLPLAAMAASLLVMAAIWNWRKRYTK